MGRCGPTARRRTMPSCTPRSPGSPFRSAPNTVHLAREGRLTSRAFPGPCAAANIAAIGIHGMNWLNDPIDVANLRRQWGEYENCARRHLEELGCVLRTLGQT